MTFDLIIVAIVILLGVIFLLVEIFLLPGMTVSGIAGFVFLVGGIAYAYMYMGAVAGNEGITQSRLNPIGKVFINNLIVEAKSINGEMIDEDTAVIVNKVDWSNILVSRKESQIN